LGFLVFISVLAFAEVFDLGRFSSDPIDEDNEPRRGIDGCVFPQMQSVTMQEKITTRNEIEERNL
jgi:hypothetical protein